MYRLACIAASVALLAAPDVDVSHILQARPPDSNQQQIPANESIPVLPNFGSAPDQQTAPAAGAPAGPLSEESRLEIIRYVSGEFAHMMVSLPAGKKGFHMKAGAAIDRNALQNAIRGNGAVVNPGDNVQITKIEFAGQAIRLDINGGPTPGQSWRNHIQLTVGDDSPVSSSTTATDPNAPPVTPGRLGAALYLDFGRALPNMSPADLKKYLAEVFDFSNQRSAAVEWAATLPPNIRDAVQQKRAEVGMDHDEVLAALGRPDRKVREQEEDGTDTEDWIYGNPPTKTVFVRFAGDKVIKVSQYP